MPLSAVAIADGGFIGGPFGSNLGRKDYVTSGVPVVRGTNVEGREARFEDAVYVTDQKADTLSRCLALPGDIVMTQRGTLGQVAVLPSSWPRYLISQSQMAIRVDNERAEPGFVLFALSSTAMRKQITDHAIVTGVPHLNLGIFKRLEIPLAPRVEQRAITSVLGAVDDKIESNRRLAEAIRRILMTAVPRHGEAVPLDSVAFFRNGGALTKYATGEGLPILRIKELRAGVTADTPRTDADVRDEHAVREGDLLFSWSGTLLTHRWTGELAVLNQHVFRVDPIEGVPRWLVEAWIEQHLDDFRRIAADKATTMGHIQRHHLTEAEVVVPHADELASLRGDLDPLDALRMGVLSEARQLTALRDALLPKLVSGQIRVPLAGEAAAGAVHSSGDTASCADDAAGVDQAP